MTRLEKLPNLSNIYLGAVPSIEYTTERDTVLEHVDPSNPLYQLNTTPTRPRALGRQGRRVLGQSPKKKNPGVLPGQTRCRDPDLNWGHRNFQSRALPTELPRHKQRATGGL